ncbi:MAG: hypothetical protein ACM3O8_02045 [Methylococcaceae bacterium]|nr:hypothetical protein [Prolixibacteraceae bacterium]
MKSNTSTALIENYFGLLNGLSKENKLRLIARLSNSVADEVVKNEDVVDKYFGAFKSDKSAEEIIKEIRESRNFNRSIEAF